MHNKQVTQNNSYLSTIFHYKCPHCREGNMFKHKNMYNLKTFMEMYDYCPVCNQKMEIEQGFYYGTGYVSYGLTVAFSVSTFVAWWVLLGFSINDNSIFWRLGINSGLMLLLQPLFMRLSRVIWLSFFVKYDANWQVVTKE